MMTMTMMIMIMMRGRKRNVQRRPTAEHAEAAPTALLLHRHRIAIYK